MQTSLLTLGTLCAPCRRSIFATPWISTAQRQRSATSSNKRYRSTSSTQKPARPHPPRGADKWSTQRAPPPWSSSQRPSHPHTTIKKPYPTIDPNNISAFFESNVTRWATHPQTAARLALYGISTPCISLLLSAFTSAVLAKELSSPAQIEYYNLSRLAQSKSQAREVDIIYSTTFFSWAANPASAPRLAGAGVKEETRAHLMQLAEAADRSFPHEEYPYARKIHRKVIMHVGPTNSGKTHHALRALAASKRGVYAGPLRLLAHEVWERLNLGQIVPLGVEEPIINPTQTPIAATAIDDAPSPAPIPTYARACNMITGEEQKIVDEDAPLLSCTVEMLNMNARFHVAVVDEIQMIADLQRGSGWTAAVLGLYAEELHLCGEETAVPIVQALLKDTGDEVIVHRYERLTPLQVEETSLEGDLSRVRKGDCIVTFRRSQIFAMKKEVERKTGMRCAVVYGRLPPEIRSEQAALFNDPESGYDVIIGSDAIGMGLNLKIRRIIFESVSKYNDGAYQHLSISQVKQIAGRAGRYGLHASDEGGFTTTLHPPDLPYLSRALSTPFAPLHHAHVTYDPLRFAALRQLLPDLTRTETILDALVHVGRLPGYVRYTHDDQMGRACALIDEVGGAAMTVSERLRHLSAPVGWRDEVMIGVMRAFLGQYRDRQKVDYLEAIANTQFLSTLESVERSMEGNNGVKGRRATGVTLSLLESFHKSAVVYIWLSFRMPVVYAGQAEVVMIKRRVEAALEWCLEGMSSVKGVHEDEREVDLTRKNLEGEIRYKSYRGTENKTVDAAAA